MSRWFRFYDDAINDPKILKLPEAMRWYWAALLCVASKYEGELPPITDIALMLRLTPQKAGSVVATLAAAGLLDKTETGFAPHNWNGRQYKSDVSTERVKRFRKREGNVSSAVSETPPETEQIQIRTEPLPSVAERADVRVRSKSKKRAMALPSDWVPSAKSYALAEQFGQNVQIVEGIFRDYVASSGKLYADHDAAFHNFIRNQNSFNRGGNNGKTQDNPRAGSIIGALDRAIQAVEAEPDFALPADNLLRISQRSV